MSCAKFSAVFGESLQRAFQNNHGILQRACSENSFYPFSAYVQVLVMDARSLDLLQSCLEEVPLRTRLSISRKLIGDIYIASLEDLFSGRKGYLEKRILGALLKRLSRAGVIKLPSCQDLRALNINSQGR